MDIGIHEFFIICPLIFIAGLVDSIGGGGGLISLPAYLFAGIPTHNAIATNKLSSSIGTVVSTLRYCKNGYFNLFLVIPSIVAALIGSAIGANLSLLIEEKIMRYVLILILPIVAYYVLKKKDYLEVSSEKLSKPVACIISILISVIIGGYDGFYGPGTGTFLILAYTNILKLDIKIASGNTKLVNLASNISALITFIINGKVLFLLGLTASLFSIAGHYIGSGLVMKNGIKIVRPIILTVIILIFVKLLLF